ncbi:MAG: aminodeoxychorismate lyase [Pseudomonadota bacterium]
MSTVVFRGNDRVQALSPQDRGLMYGDGLFETLRASRGDLPWWPAHWRRLQKGAERLGLALPDEGMIHAAAQELLDARPQVLKIVLTRGESGRGYLPAAGPATCILSTHPLPSPIAEPLHLHWCTTPIAQQPVLAGMKHLNRLENVLARGECADSGYAEGLMCDRDGHVVCATAANVFVYAGGQWQTPELSQCGIAGIAREHLLSMLEHVRIGPLTRSGMDAADAVFLCNAVRGIMEVRRIGSVPIIGHVALDALQQRFLDAHPFFADE